MKIGLPYDLANLFLGIYQRKMKTLTQKDILTSMFICNIIYNGKT